ncbi:MAG: pentapeptide repeat-containing protein, partial [Pseudomonadota bacterium]
LSGARMEGANLSGARMEGADLSRARMEGADLSRARMEGADLSEARMEVANLSRARMEGANLRGARMEGAVLYEVRMEGAFLLEALFGHSLIWYTSMKSALISHVTFDGAGLMSADFSNSFYVEPVASRTTFLSAFGDGSVLLPEGVAAPAHWPEESLTKSAFLARWRGWRESRGLPWPPPGRALSDEVFSGAVFGLGFGLFDLPSIPATPPNRPVDPSEIADP